MHPSNTTDADTPHAPDAVKAMDAPVTADALRASLLNQLLGIDDDLKLWLKYSGFFNLARREFTLDKLRKLNAIEDERSELLLELGIVNTQKDEAIISVTTKPLSASDTPVLQQSKPAGNGSPPAMACEPAAGLESFPTAPRISTVINDSAGAPPATSSSSASPKSAWATPVVATPAGPHLGPAASATTQNTMQAPVRLKDSRFFLVKCSNTANIYMSQRDGLWVTQAKNEPLFTKAFNECESVILFFSINKSRYFQGFARMTSLPNGKLEKPDWIKRINLTAVTEPFTVEWINQSDTSFDDVGDLRNSLNDYRSVVVGRDGQEYPVECARKMMAIMSQSTPKPQALKSIPMMPRSTKPVYAAWKSPCKFPPTSLKADDDSHDRTSRLNWRPQQSDASNSDGLRHGAKTPNLIDFQGQL